MKLEDICQDNGKKTLFKMFWVYLRDKAKMSLKDVKSVSYLSI